MKLFLTLMCLLPLTVLASWQADISIAVDGETFKTENQKFEDGKESSMKVGNYQLKLTLKKSKEPKLIDVVYHLQETKVAKVTIINKGQDIIEEKISNDIYAKGEPNQPHSIITIKFKN